MKGLTAYCFIINHDGEDNITDAAALEVGGSNP